MGRRVIVATPRVRSWHNYLAAADDKMNYSIKGMC